MAYTPNCEDCDERSATVFMFGKKLCAGCMDARFKANQEPKSPTAPNIPNNPLIAAAQKIDESVQVRTDLFNAETIAIADLKKAIDEDSSIPADKKQFILAQTLTTRVNGYKQAIFDLNQQVADESTKQRAVQQYLNTLAANLREEERAKIRAQDMTYQPKTAIQRGPIKANKVNVIAKAMRITQTDLEKAAKESGIPAATIKMFCVAKGIGVDVAVMQLKAAIAASQAKN